MKTQTDGKATARLMLGKRPTADDGDYFTIREIESSKLVCEGRWSEVVTARIIVRAVNERSALVAVAKAAGYYVEQVPAKIHKLRFEELQKAVAQLAVVRGQ